MDLFAIQCTTCRARLKVHDPAAVGLILDCPKCGSLVQVTPPADWQPPEPSVTRASVPPPLPGQNAGLQLAHDADVAAGFPGLVALRQRWWIGAVAAGGVSVAALCVYLVASAHEHSLLAPTATLESAATLGSTATLGSAGADPAAREPLADETPQSTTPALTDATALALAESPRAAESAEPRGEEHKANSPRAAADAPPAADDASTTKPDARTPGEAPPAATVARSNDDSADPLDPVARALAPEPEPQANNDPAGLFTELFPSSGAMIAETAAPAGNSAPAEEASDEVSRQGRLETHLQDKLAGVDFKDTPLTQFTAFLSEFSTVPIAIDVASLNAAGKGPHTHVTVKLKNVTVEQALRTALARHGLTLQIEIGRVLIVADPLKHPTKE